MFFTQSLVSSDRRKQPHQLFQRVLSKYLLIKFRPEKGIDELREYLQARIEQEEYHQVQSIINYVSFRNTHQGNTATRIILIQCLQIAIMEIRTVPYESGLGKTIPEMITIILSHFKDPFDKVRYQAITSIYNIITFYNQAFLPMFTNTFNCLLSVINDEILEIRVVVFHLDHCMKKLLNLLISSDEFFDVNEFMAMLIQNFIAESTLSLKEFLIDWLIAIDQIPEFQISFYLPLVFKELFRLLESENEAIKDKSQECLKSFLSGFKELLRNTVRIENKIREDSFSMLMSVLLEVVKESIHSKIKYHSLEWLEVFTQLFYNELIKKDHVEVRRSFRSEYLLKEMKEPKNHSRTSKILSFIRQEMVENGSETDSIRLLNGIDFLPTHKYRQKPETFGDQGIILQERFTPDFEMTPTLQKAVTNVLKTTQFFVEVFLSFYDKIIVLVMHSFSDDDQKIRKITTNINNILLQSFPIVQEKAKVLKNQYPVHTIITNQSQNYLERLEIPLIIKLGKFLKESRTTQKIEAIIKWIKILYEKGQNPQLNLQITQLIQKIVQKICEKPVSHILPFNSPMPLTPSNNRSTPIIHPTFAHGSFNFNKGLFNLLADSIFLQKYLDLFIQTLLSYFYQNEGIDFERILIDVISMKIQKTNKSTKKQVISNEKVKQNSVQSTQLIYITILKRLMLFETQKVKFKKKMIENMISILITQNSLSGLRKKLRSTSIRSKYLGKDKIKENNGCFQVKNEEQVQILQLIQQLFQYFCLNEGFTIIFCFLTGMYSLINKILKHIAEQNLLDRPKIKSFIKASNLLECYNLNHFKLDILQNYVALKGYLGYLMVIPPSKLNKVLLNRFPQNFVLKINDPQNQSLSNSDDFEQKLFMSYLKIVQKYKQDVIIMQKLEIKRKERERQASMMTLGIFNLSKQLGGETKQKTILKSSSTKVLHQSQSERNLKTSPSFHMLQSSQSHKRLSFASSKVSLPYFEKEITLNHQEQHLVSHAYSQSQTPYQLSDESLQFGGSENGLQKQKTFMFEKSVEDLQTKQNGQKKKKKNKELTIKVIDMQID